jgi:hypothetical protein
MSEEIRNHDHAEGLASEPMVGYALQDYPVMGAESETDFDFQGKDFGYAKTIEELELALDEADVERNNPTKWITPVEFHTRLERTFYG